MATLSEFKSFDIASAIVTLWVFRKTSVTGGPPQYRGRWAQLGDDLTAAMKAVAIQSIGDINETLEYGLLAQNNEGSAITIPLIETHADAVKQKASAEINERRVGSKRHLDNTVFYAIKFTLDDKSLYGIKKTDNSWRTKKQKGLVSIIFVDQTLVIDDNMSFNLSRSFDFFLFDDEVFVKNKASFESILEYKNAHKDDFITLQAEKEFKEAFVDLSELETFVGDNKILLRRMSAIHQKGHYKNTNFMLNLRRDYARVGLNIKFDTDGKIAPSQETCRDILQALLDFRLFSLFSANVYDVPDTSAPPPSS